LEPHSDLAETAGAKMGVLPEYCQILSAEANTPDSGIRYPGDHFWYVSIRMGDGPFRTKYYANEAIKYLKKSNPSEEDPEILTLIGYITTIFKINHYLNPSYPPKSLYTL